MATPTAGWPEISENQENKEITHNEALRLIEAISYRVLSRSNGGPPSSPADGDSYIVDDASGDWSNFAVDDVAAFINGGWLATSPFEGLGPLWVNDEDVRVNYTGSSWDSDLSGGIDVEDGGTSVVTDATGVNFGSNLSVTDDNDGTVTVDASGGSNVAVEDSGSTVQDPTQGINFGNNLSVTDDGDGTVTVDSTGGTGSITWEQKSAAFTADVNTRYLTDTSGSAFTATMPASPSVGDTVYFADSARSWGTNNLTVDGNGNNVIGNSTLEVDVSEWNFSLVYNGTQWVFGDTSGNLFQAPENATDGGTDAYASDNTTSTPTSGVVISRDFQSANTTTTPTLDSVSIVARDGSSVWIGALNRIHYLLYDGTNYRVVNPNYGNDVTGLDGTVVTGTAGTGGNVSEWNADGDLVDTGVATSNLLVDSDLAANGGSVPEIDRDNTFSSDFPITINQPGGDTSYLTWNKDGVISAEIAYSHDSFGQFDISFFDDSGTFVSSPVTINDGGIEATSFTQAGNDVVDESSFGNPTSSEVGKGAIVESGSNSNGNYVRWENGEQVCWKDKVEMPYSSDDRLRTDQDFPADFSERPSVSATISNHRDETNAPEIETVIGPYIFDVELNRMQALDLRIIPGNSATFSSDTIMYVSYIAWGFWK